MIRVGHRFHTVKRGFAKDLTKTKAEIENQKILKQVGYERAGKR